MSRKDYTKLAQALKDSKPANINMLEDSAYVALKQWNITCENMAFMLAQNNPRFNREKFLTACGYND